MSFARPAPSQPPCPQRSRAPRSLFGPVLCSPHPTSARPTDEQSGHRRRGSTHENTTRVRVSTHPKPLHILSKLSQCNSSYNLMASFREVQNFPKSKYSTPLKIITLNWTFGSADFPFQLGKVSVNQPSNFQGLITKKMGLADWLEFQGCTGISYQLYGISWDVNLCYSSHSIIPVCNSTHGHG